MFLVQVFDVVYYFYYKNICFIVYYQIKGIYVYFNYKYE